MAKAQGTDVSAILNIIRSTASSAYQDTVPLATADNITDVGVAVLTAPQPIKNEFMSNLVNKIGLTLIDYPVVNNHIRKENWNMVRRLKTFTWDWRSEPILLVCLTVNIRPF